MSQNASDGSEKSGNNADERKSSPVAQDRTVSTEIFTEKFDVRSSKIFDDELQRISNDFQERINPEDSENSNETKIQDEESSDSLRNDKKNLTSIDSLVKDERYEKNMNLIYTDNKIAIIDVALDDISTKGTDDDTWNIPVNQNSTEEPRRILTQTKKGKRALSLIDTIISVTVIVPLVVGFWRGIWNLMDYHLFSAWFGLPLGVGIHILFAFLKDRFHTSYTDTRNKKNIARRLISRIGRIFYTYIFGVACNSHWRAGWILIDIIFVPYPWSIAPIMCLLILILALMRCVRNLLAPPFVIFVDASSYVFQFPTRYNLNTRDWSLYLLDCAFSVGVVGTLVVFVWRGVWILLDLYLFPEDREYSALGSLAIGYAIVVVTFCLQPLMRYICARLRGFSRLIVADIFLLLSFLATVNVWRGIWNILDLWLLPDNLELSCWITHVGCFVFLVLLNCSNSILVRGIYIDAEEEEGKCVVFPCHYLRLFFKIEREKKEARRRNLLVASKDFVARTEGSGKDPENGALLPNSTNATIIPANPESHV